MAGGTQSVLIIGGGIMGGDIAIIFAAGNRNVHVMSPSEKTRSSLPARLNAGLKKLGAAETIAAGVKTHASLDTIPWAEIDLVVEAATEDLALKKKLFSQLETLARPEIPLASNTSTFPIGEIGGHLKTRSRVVGLHYFMPAHLVPLVEIIQADFTDKAIGDALEKDQKALGKAPVRVNKDIPGFIGNRLQHAMMREALYLVADGVVSPEGIDTAVRYGFGFRFLALGRELLQIHFAVGAEDQAGVEIAQVDFADAQFERFEVELKGVQVEQFPLEQVVGVALFNGREVGDVDAAVVVDFCGTVAAAIEN